MMQETLRCTIYESPVGNLLLGATNTHLVLCDWLDKEGNPRPQVINRITKFLGVFDVFSHAGQDSNEVSSLILTEAITQLNEYFSGTRQSFTLPIQTFGTHFQQQVWQQLQNIPYGNTMTYKQQAAALNMPNAIRAVANANRLNALSIIIPCHRVIGSDSNLSTPNAKLLAKILTGYAGGLEAKRWLLNHESRNDMKI